MPTLPLSLKPRIPAATPIFSPSQRLKELLGLLYPAPSEWLKTSSNGHNGSNSKTTGEGGGLECTPCSNYTLIVGAWEKAVKWTPGLDHAMAAMLAAVASTRTLGDQLWLKVIGPASCGKSTLCEAISLNKTYVYSKSTIRGFHSGYKTDGGGDGEDNSMIPSINGKTLVTKDGDTLLQSPNLSQILSEARDLYDCTSRTHYRNKMGKDYEGIRMTWLLCGTNSLKTIDQSELGERFLDVVIMDGIDDALEDEILVMAADQADRGLSLEADENTSTHYDPALATAMQLTGGYVNWLRENATNVLSTITMSHWAKNKCAKLGKFIAHMRARPSIRQEEVAEREFAARLVKQLVRLAKCLALVLNKRDVDAEVIARVRQVALDTSRGKTLAMASHLYDKPEGMHASTMSMYVSLPEEKTKALLRFLKVIGVTELYEPDPVGGIKQKPRWRLTKRMFNLYREAIERK